MGLQLSRCMPARPPTGLCSQTPASSLVATLRRAPAPYCFLGSGRGLSGSSPSDSSRPEPTMAAAVSIRRLGGRRAHAGAATVRETGRRVAFAQRALPPSHRPTRCHRDRLRANSRQSRPPGRARSRPRAVARARHRAVRPAPLQRVRGARARRATSRERVSCGGTGRCPRDRWRHLRPAGGPLIERECQCARESCQPTTRTRSSVAAADTSSQYASYRRRRASLATLRYRTHPPP